MNGQILFEQTTKLVDTCLREDAKTVIVHQGGSSSSKTYSILQALCILAYAQKKQVITVVGQDIPNLRKGSYRDIKGIISTSQTVQNAIEKINESDRIVYFKNGSLIEFTSFKDFQDAKNGKRDYLFANEANGISYEIFEELNVRTSKKTFIDFNPTARFWAHDKLQGLPNVLWVKSNFRHNPFINPNVRNKILGYEPTAVNVERGTADEYRWQVYGLGETGKLEGLVFPDFKLCYDFPEHDTDKRIFGLDFGFTNDPTALIEVVQYNGELYFREWIFQSGLTNSDIVEEMNRLNFNFNETVICDSAEPKSIEELKRLGVKAKGATKGKDSILFGIDLIKQYKINVHARSKNLIEEFNSYTWAKDKDGLPTNKPIDKYNHGLDSARYASTELLNYTELAFY
jgi:phage terminase large subunit